MTRSPVRRTAGLLLASALVAGSGAPTAASLEPSGRASPPDTVRAPQVVAADAPKTAVLGSAAGSVGEEFVVLDEADVPVLTGTLDHVEGTPAPWAHAALADFSDVTDPGIYVVRVGDVESAPITVEADPYPEILDSLLGIYDANADGAEPSSYHGASHLHDARSKIRNGPLKGDRVDVTGGWMDSGDQLKFTVTIAYAATMVGLAARNEPAMAGQLGEVADVGTRWLLKAHPSKRVFVSQVGDVDADHNSGFRDPVDDDSSSVKLLAHRPSLVLTDKTGGADVAGLASAALALAAQRAPQGRQRDRLVRAAEQWWAEARRLEKPWRNCCYSQDTVRDDLAAAAVELWRATGDPAYRRAALKHLVAVTADGEDKWRISMDGYEMAALPAAELCGVLGQPAVGHATTRETACRILRSGGRDVIDRVDGNAFGRGGPITWGSVRQNQNGSLVALLAGQDGLAGATGASMRALGWFLGANPWGVRFQAGHGVDNPYHWAQLDGPGIPDGAVVGGPETYAVVDDQDPGPTVELGPYDTEAAVYRDVAEDWVTNEVGIPYNAAAVLLLAVLSDG